MNQDVILDALALCHGKSCFSEKDLLYAIIITAFHANQQKENIDYGYMVLEKSGSTLYLANPKIDKVMIFLMERGYIQKIQLGEHRTLYKTTKYYDGLTSRLCLKSSRTIQQVNDGKLISTSYRKRFPTYRNTYLYHFINNLPILNKKTHINFSEIC